MSLSEKRVLVVGAGPVGLAAGLFFLDVGIKPRIIDSKTQVSAYSKALAINSRSLEIMSEVGATERFLAEGIKIHSGRMYY